MIGSTMFWAGLITVAVGFGCFMVVCDTSTRTSTVVEDICAFVCFAGLIIATVGALLWLGRVLG